MRGPWRGGPGEGAFRACSVCSPARPPRRGGWTASSTHVATPPVRITCMYIINVLCMLIYHSFIVPCTRFGAEDCKIHPSIPKRRRAAAVVYMDEDYVVLSKPVVVCL